MRCGPARRGSCRSLGQAGLPASGVRAVVVNTTLTGVSRDLDVQVAPSGTNPSPRTSNLNAVRGQTVANLVTVGSAATAASP